MMILEKCENLMKNAEKMTIDTKAVEEGVMLVLLFDC